MVNAPIKTSQASKRAGLSVITRKAQEAVDAATATAAPTLSPTEIGSRQLAFEQCVDTLMAGCVTAFVELFTLSHRDPVCVDPLANKMFSIPDSKIPEIQSTLVNAEKARRNGEFQRVYDCHTELANYFEDEGDYVTALHFHEVGLEHAKVSSDKELEGAAYENYGNAHERQNNTQQAIVFHETHLRVAEASRNATMKQQAHSNLFRVYMRRAGECEKSGDYKQARSFYEKSMNTALACNDAAAQGEAYHKLGDITILLGDLERALEYQTHFLKVSSRIQNDVNVGKAQMSLARLQEDLGRVSDADNSLRESLQIAETQKDDKAVCEVCTKLGLLHNKQGNYVTAVHYLAQNYRVAQKIGDPHMVQKARVLVGLAQGNQHWATGFVKTVATDLDTMLRWKCQAAMQDE